MDNDPSSGYDDDISDDEIDRRLAAANLIPTTSAADPAASATPAPAPTIPAAPSVPPITAAALSAPVQAPVAPAPAPAAAVPASTGTNAGTSGDDAASIKSLLAGGTDDDTDTTATDNAAAQSQRNQAATNRYLKSQGAAMTVTPTGQETQATDPQGVGLYKKAVVEPFWRDPADNEAYRISRNEYGNYQSDRIADGADGTDFHTDPQTGEQFVPVSGADGGSRRETIGQNHFIPAANAIKAAQQGHQADAEAAGQTADEAEQGVAGAGGLGSYALSDLKQYRQGLSRQVGDAQDTVDRADSYMRSGGTLNGPQLDALRTAQSTLSQTSPQVSALENEIGTRQSAITQARQQRITSTAAMRDAAGFRNVLSTPQGQTQVKADLGSVLAGGNINSQQATRYATAGLVQDDGNGGYALTDRGLGILNGGRAPQQPTAAPIPAQLVPGAQPSSSLPASGDTTAGGDDPSQPLPVRIGRIRQNTLDQQRTILSEFPAVGQPGSAANLKFIRAFQATGSDPRKALQVARVVFG